MKFSDIILLENEMEFNEAGASRVLQTLRGMVPKVRTIAILTAENPHSKELSPRENNERNLKLELQLANGQYSFRKIKGKYNNKENSFMVNNMSKNVTLSFGKQFEQESVIFGEYYEENDRYGMKFELLSTELKTFGEVISERKIFISHEGQDNMYSEIKGRKFQIPFFDSTKVIEKKNKKTDETEKRLITRDYSNSRWGAGDTGKVLGSKKISDIKLKEIPPEEVNKIEKLQEDALNSVGYNSYVKRGMIREILKKYK